MTRDNGEKATSRTDQNLIFDDECDWPRRLLHLPTLTSYEWSPGDQYGEHSKPDYVALSYTWGRWRLRDGELPEVTALPVTGVTWEIPRVNPNHFSAAEFENVLKTLPALVDKYLHFNTIKYEFAWVDVTCIDQTPGSPASAAEIGRQAKIFKGASEVFAWLTSYPDACENDFARADDILERLSESQWGELEPDAALEKDGAAVINFLFRDPWFSSLWTLQEAFLCQETILLSRNAEPWPPVTPQQEVARLRDLAMWVDLALNLTDRAYNLHNSSKLHISFERSGLMGLILKSPIVLLTAAQYRKTSPENETDRVYGIMQAFNFRLGKSRRNEDPAKEFTLLELEEELGKELLRQYPIISQLHVFMQRPDPGQGWRVSRSSQVAYALWDVYDNYGDPWETMTHFSTKIVDNMTWGIFSGLLCSLQALCAAWGSYIPHVSTWDVPLWIAEDLKEPCRGKIPQNHYFDLAKNILRDQPSAVVLMLGRRVQRDAPKRISDRCLVAGLILAPPKSNERQPHAGFWRRVGICTWRPSRFDLKSDALNTVGSYGGYAMEVRMQLWGETNHWVTTNGVFG